MKIRTRLTLLIVGILALFATAVSLCFVLLVPAGKMEKEKSYLIGLSYAMRLRQVALNKLSFRPIVSAYQAFTEASGGVETSFKNLENVKVLPTANKNLKVAFAVIEAPRTSARHKCEKSTRTT
jgi:hypothetical protein